LGFEEHSEQTKGHVDRLETIFKELGEKPRGKKCRGMEGLVEESNEMITPTTPRDWKIAGGIDEAQLREASCASWRLLRLRH